MTGAEKRDAHRVWEKQALSRLKLGNGVDLNAIELDVGSQESVDAGVAAIIEKHGHLDVVMHKEVVGAPGKGAGNDDRGFDGPSASAHGHIARPSRRWVLRTFTSYSSASCSGVNASAGPKAIWPAPRRSPMSKNMPRTSIAAPSLPHRGINRVAGIGQRTGGQSAKAAGSAGDEDDLVHGHVLSTAGLKRRCSFVRPCRHWHRRCIAIIGDVEDAEGAFGGSPIRALGSYLGCLTAKRCCGLRFRERWPGTS